jgi:hypothetical protein
MHSRIVLTALLIASCAPSAPPSPPPVAEAPGAERFLDQGWSAADRSTFETTAQGSQLMPLVWFMALQRTDMNTPFAGDQLKRYGYLPSSGSLPIGFVAGRNRNDAQLGMTCAACHTGQLRYRGITWRIDGGRADADFQAFLTDLGAASRATLDHSGRFADFATKVLGTAPPAARAAELRNALTAWTAQYEGFMRASLPNPAWGPGRLDAFGMIFNRVTGADLGHAPNFDKADAPVRYPFIWDAPRQDKTQWTGAAPNGTYLRGLARNTGEVFGVFGHFDPALGPLHRVAYNNSVDFQGLQVLEEKVVALRAPPWPDDVFPLDAARVVRGEALFATGCASCHGIKESSLVQRAWDTPLRDVGTDRRTFYNALRTADPRVLEGSQQPPLVGERLGNPAKKLDILANAVVGSLLRAARQQEPAIRRAIRRDILEGRLPLLNLQPSEAQAVIPADIASATADLYKVPATGPGAAYAARVLTGIWTAGPYLHNGSVPSLWELLKPPGERITRFAIGHREFDPVAVGLDTAAAPGRAMFEVDASNGNGNGGHDYGTTLPEEDRWALVEYLKTLR